ncbi:DUF4142 domain-containing protein [Caenispirillum bisanense]|uniref:DUF4142 domain-containing protein n=1 Tax=Caenispirillum bisanense TaxID=414052 RepID=UPI0031E2FA81
MADDDKHTGLQGAADRAQDMMGGMMGRASAAMAGDNTGVFIENATIGDLYEREAARIALERSGTDMVRHMAMMMLDDHYTSTHQLQSTLRSIPDAPHPPDGLDTRRNQMVEHLRTATDEDFDSRYLEQQEMAHKETLTLFTNYADSGADPRLRLFAQATVPALRRHLAAVQAMR